MVNYRRNKIKGGSYFFTVTLRNRKSKILIDHVDLLRQSLNQVKIKKPYQIKAIVILPEHLHAIFELPEGDKDYAGRWRWIKGLFTKQLLKRGVKLKQDARGEYNLWQKRYWEHTIRDEKDLEKHIDYIHYNPVKHGLVKEAKDWKYSSFHRYVKEGLISPNWGCKLEEENTDDFGE